MKTASWPLGPLRVCAALVLLGAGRFASAADDTPTGPIELPKFIVTDSRELPPPEKWRYATIPGFEILSNASDRATQRLLRDFSMFRQALGHVWPLSNRLQQPAMLIICGRGNKFDPFVPSAHRQVVPESGLASLLLKKGDRAAIVIDLQSTTLNVLNFEGFELPGSGTDSGLVSVEHDKQLYREYVRYLLSASEPRLPAWVEEGLSQIIMKMQFDRRWIQFAKLEDPNTISAQAAMVAEINALSGDDEDALLLPGAPAEDRDFPAALRRRALVPLERFFAVTHDSKEATNVLGTNIWAKQAYAFVHMCLYGERGKFKKPFATFLQRISREPVSEALFKECFNMTYKQMLMQIRGYCDFTVYEHQEFRSKQDVLIPPPPLELRDATESEVGRMKGEAFVLAGHARAARNELIAPYIRGERDPDLLAALGLYERSDGEEERARKFLEAAHAAKTTRADALLELARFRYADALASPGGENGRFSPVQFSSILEPLLVARRHPPPRVPIYDLIADAWARSDAAPTREDAQVLIDGAILFPARLRLVYQAAVLAAETGEIRPAHALADHGVQYAPDSGTKTRFAELKAALPPAPPVAEAAPTASTPPAPPPPAAPTPRSPRR
jgi:hypothetical protein